MEVPLADQPAAEPCRLCPKAPDPEEINNNNNLPLAPEDDTTVILSRSGVIPPELHSRFETMQAGLNFGLRHSELEPRLQVIFEGERFQFYCFWPQTGTSSWKCVFHRVQGCRAVVQIDGEMTVAKLELGGHRHSAVADRLLAWPEGWGTIAMEGSVEELFWLSHGEKPHRTGQFTRALIVDGYRYNLQKINQNESSFWYCSRQSTGGCKARLLVQGVFQQAKLVDQQPHNHEPNLAKHVAANVDCKDLATGAARIRKGDLVFKRLTDNDGQSFRLQSIEPDGSHLWCCVWKDIRNCPVTVRMSADLKRVEPENDLIVHNHADDVIGVYLEKDGRSSIFDKQEKVKLPFWLFTIKPESNLKERGIIYQGYKYLLVTISDRGDSTWKCTACETTLQITGLFWTASQQDNHSHCPLSIEDINAITENPQESNALLPLTNSIPLSKSTLIATLSTFNPNRTFQFLLEHQHPNNLKILQDGFEYFYVGSRPTYSLWHCIYHRIRCCNATLRISNDGTLQSTPQHNHTDQLWDLYFTPLGENHILDGRQTLKPFHFLIQPTFLRPLPHLIYEGHLFSLFFITECGNGSIWSCTGSGDCRVALNVAGRFAKITSVEGLPHVDQPLGEDEQVEWVVRYGSEDSF